MKNLLILISLMLVSITSISQTTSIPLVLESGDTSFVIKTRYIIKANNVFLNHEKMRFKSLLLERRINILEEEVELKNEQISLQSKKILNLEGITKIDEQRLRNLNKQNNILQQQVNKKDLLIKWGGGLSVALLVTSLFL